MFRRFIYFTILPISINELASRSKTAGLSGSSTFVVIHTFDSSTNSISMVRPLRVVTFDEELPGLSPFPMVIAFDDPKENSRKVSLILWEVSLAALINQMQSRPWEGPNVAENRRERVTSVFSRRRFSVPQRPESKSNLFWLKKI